MCARLLSDIKVETVLIVGRVNAYVGHACDIDSLSISHLCTTLSCFQIFWWIQTHNIVGRVWLRRSCRDAIETFNSIVKSSLLESLTYCRCSPNHVALAGGGGGGGGGGANHEFNACDWTRLALSSPCSVADIPPPTCIDLVNRCLEDDDCR